jgi:hypothetical protein
MVMGRLNVNSRGYRRMALPELEDLILSIRRQAAVQHLNTSEWAFIDSLRARAERLRRGSVR